MRLTIRRADDETDIGSTLVDAKFVPGAPGTFVLKAEPDRLVLDCANALGPTMPIIVKPGQRLLFEVAS